MRQIKFRVWDKKLNIYHNSNSYSIDGMGIFKVYPMDSHENYTLEDNLVIEQHIGVCDKDSFDIYEGDILKVYRYIQGMGVPTKGGEDGGFNWYHKIEAGIVEWNKGLCRYNIRYKSYDDYDDMGFWSHRYEIIGNIHECEIDIFNDRLI